MGLAGRQRFRTDQRFQEQAELFGKHGATLQRYFLQGFVATVPIEFNHFREIAD
jgi:hypothetical protein